MYIVCIICCSQGGETELSGDFRVLENPDGSVSFELAKAQGVFIKTDNGEKDFTLYQVVSVCVCVCVCVCVWYITLSGCTYICGTCSCINGLKFVV